MIALDGQEAAEVQELLVRQREECAQQASQLEMLRQELEGERSRLEAERDSFEAAKSQLDAERGGAQPGSNVRAALAEMFNMDLDSAASAASEEASAIAAGLQGLALPGLEAEASEIGEQARAANELILRELENRITAAEERRQEAALALADNPYVSCPNRSRHRRTERERRNYEAEIESLGRDLATARKAASRQARTAAHVIAG